MLGEHNAARSQVGVGTLSWSKSLALGAQKWSDKLKSEDCKMRHDPNTPYGENIYWAWSSDANVGGLISEPDEAVTMWVNEESFYNYEKNTCKAGEQCGHYTQVVWESTTEVGCGVSSCFDGDAQTDVWVCRYSPAGNDGSRPF
jgi:pathogenesis-related protein 1